MAGDWEETTLGECAVWLSGGTPFKGNEAFWSGPIPWVSAKDMKSFRLHDAEDHISPLAVGNGGKLVPAGTILLLVRGMTLHNDVPICMITREMAFNQDIKALQPAKNVDGAFLAYWLLANKPELLASVDHAGHGTGRLVTDTLKEKQVLLPPLAKQKAIAAVLGALDDKIELNRRMNATLEAMARALFQSWFVDFDPVRAKLDGREPFGLDLQTAALFPATFDETNGGNIPHGWRVGSIYEIANVIYGAPFASSLFNSEKLGKPLIRIRDLPNESPAVFTTEVHPKGFLLRPGDIAVGMDGEFRAYLWAGVESWLNQRVCVFAPKPGYSSAFVRSSIIAPLAEVEATETATTVIHLGKNDIDRFTVIIPDASVAEAFERQCQPWYDQIVANKQQSRTLASLRDTLLPKLLSGKLPAVQSTTL